MHRSRVVISQQLPDLILRRLALLRSAQQVVENPFGLKSEEVHRHLARAALQICRIERDGKDRIPIEAERPLPIPDFVWNIGRPGLGVPFLQPTQGIPEATVVLLDAEFLAGWSAHDDDTRVWTEEMGAAQISAKGRAQHADVAWVGQIARLKENETIVVFTEAYRGVHAGEGLLTRCDSCFEVVVGLPLPCGRIESCFYLRPEACERLLVMICASELPCVQRGTQCIVNQLVILHTFRKYTQKIAKLRLDMACCSAEDKGDDIADAQEEDA
jgi:hypothetical protein